MTTRSVLDLIFPPDLYCGICGNYIDSTNPYHLCDHCVRHIRWDHGPPAVRSGLLMMRTAEYGIYERTLIFSLKYGGKRYLARDAADMSADRLREAGISLDVVVPVPLARRKERARGYNQAGLIGKYLAVRMDADFIPDALVRTRETRPMRGLSREERAENVRGVFRLNEKAQGRIRGRRVLLFDDFATTGSTAREAVRALREAEPASVLFYAFAAKYGEALDGREVGGGERRGISDDFFAGDA